MVFPAPAETDTVTEAVDLCNAPVTPRFRLRFGRAALV